MQPVTTSTTSTLPALPKRATSRPGSTRSPKNLLLSRSLRGIRRPVAVPHGQLKHRHRRMLFPMLSTCCNVSLLSHDLSWLSISRVKILATALQLRSWQWHQNALRPTEPYKYVQKTTKKSKSGNALSLSRPPQMQLVLLILWNYAFKSAPISRSRYYRVRTLYDLGSLHERILFFRHIFQFHSHRLKIRDAVHVTVLVNTMLFASNLVLDTSLFCILLFWFESNSSAEIRPCIALGCPQRAT